MSGLVRWCAGALCALASVTFAQERPSESDMFGATDSVADAGQSRPAENDMFGEQTSTDGGAAANQDLAQLNSGPIKSRFDTDDVKADPLKIGGNMYTQFQVFGREGAKLADEAFSAPTVLETYLDARPNERVRAFVNGRLTYDPTRPTSSTTTTTSTAGANTIGLTSLNGPNPNVQLDQLWLRFDIMQKVFLTVGRQKVRWGVSRIWYPTDFLNSAPRDAFNPFDARLGVNMVKVHVPIESLGWNFYAYGLLDNIDPNSTTGFNLSRIGAAARAEFVIGPAELTGSAVYMPGRRPRYAFDLSTPLGPIDFYAEVAIRSAKDFTKYNLPSDLTVDNFVSKWVSGDITPYHPTGPTAQTSGGLSYTWNYNDKNTITFGVEYFFNPMGYSSPAEYLVQSFLPAFDGSVLDPSQRVSLYQGKHSVALTVAAPGLPNLTWVTLSLSSIANLSDPSGLTRLDAIFRVLTYLNVQAFAAVFYGQPGGELRFQLPASLPSQVAPFVTADQLKSLKSTVSLAGQPPLFQAGVLLRLSI